MTDELNTFGEIQWDLWLTILLTCISSNGNKVFHDVEPENYFLFEFSLCHFSLRKVDSIIYLYCNTLVGFRIQKTYLLQNLEGKHMFQKLPF